MNKNEILTPARTYVWLAPVGTAFPASPAGPFVAPWRNVGHTTEDSLQFETSPEFEEFRSAQSDYAVKKFQTSDAATVQVDLAQWNGANLKAVHGGGSITKVGTAPNEHFKFTPPRVGEREDVAAAVHVKEGDKNYLYALPITTQSEGVSSSLGKGAVSTLPLRLDVLGGDDADAWYMLTDDEAFDLV